MHALDAPFSRAMSVTDVGSPAPRAAGCATRAGSSSAPADSATTRCKTTSSPLPRRRPGHRAVVRRGHAPARAQRAPHADLEDGRPCRSTARGGRLSRTGTSRWQDGFLTTAATDTSGDRRPRRTPRSRALPPDDTALAAPPRSRSRSTAWPGRASLERPATTSSSTPRATTSRRGRCIAGLRTGSAPRSGGAGAGTNGSRTLYVVLTAPPCCATVHL